jgi:hypothetical protein
MTPVLPQQEINSQKGTTNFGLKLHTSLLHSHKVRPIFRIWGIHLCYAHFATKAHQLRSERYSNTEHTMPYSMHSPIFNPLIHHSCNPLSLAHYAHLRPPWPMLPVPQDGVSSPRPYHTKPRQYKLSDISSRYRCTFISCPPNPP